MECACCAWWAGSAVLLYVLLSTLFMYLRRCDWLELGYDVVGGWARVRKVYIFAYLHTLTTIHPIVHHTPKIPRPEILILIYQESLAE